MRFYHLTCNDVIRDNAGEHFYADKRFFFSKTLMSEFLIKHMKKYNNDIKRDDVGAYYSIAKIDTEKCQTYENVFLESKRRLVFSRIP